MDGSGRRPLSSRRPLFSRGLLPGELIAADCLVALCYTALFMAFTLTDPHRSGPAADMPGWSRCLLVAGVGLPVAVRRLWPVPVTGIVFPLSVAAMALGVVREPFIASAFALYLVALNSDRPRWATTPTIVVAGTGVLLVASLASAPAWWRELPRTALLGVAALGGAWTVGRAVRERRVYLDQLLEQRAGRAVADERLRIARELHDIVAHSVGLITVKASIANHVLRVRPQEAEDALRVIETVSRSALSEMRDMLAVLRSDTSDGTSDALAPSPGIAGLPELGERAAAAGVRLEMDIRGTRELPGGVELSVYRIVQEALTNVVKHAAPARCRVEVDGHGGVVRIEVTDDGPDPGILLERSRQPGGHGLIGMRERVTMYGGVLTSGPRPEGGYRVSVRLPYRHARTNAPSGPPV